MRIKSEHSKIVKKNGGQSHIGSGSEFFSLSDERSGKPSGSDSSSENADSLSSSEVSESDTSSEKSDKQSDDGSLDNEGELIYQSI